VQSGDHIQVSRREASGAKFVLRRPSTRQNSSQTGPILAGFALDKSSKGLTCSLWPKLNLREQVWRWLRAVVRRKHYTGSLDAAVTAAKGFFAKLVEQPEACAATDRPDRHAAPRDARKVYVSYISQRPCWTCTNRQAASGLKRNAASFIHVQARLDLLFQVDL
jgi:hypothetical protein